MNAQGLAFQKDEGRSVWVLDDLCTIKFAGEAPSVTEVKAFPQNGPPPHIHRREDESFWVLDGEFSVMLGDQMLTAGPGMFVHVPRGTLDTYKSVGRAPGRMIVMLTPPADSRSCGKIWANPPLNSPLRPRPIPL